MAFEKMIESAGNVVGFRVVGTITRADYEELTPQVEALVEQEGSIRLLYDMEEFKWQGIRAWGADLRFGRTYHNKIEKMAIVGDRRWERWLAKIADPFYAQEAQYFSTDDRAAAWDWLREE